MLNASYFCRKTSLPSRPFQRTPNNNQPAEDKSFQSKTVSNGNEADKHESEERLDSLEMVSEPVTVVNNVEAEVNANDMAATEKASTIRQVSDNKQPGEIV